MNSLCVNFHSGVVPQCENSYIDLVRFWYFDVTTSVVRSRLSSKINYMPFYRDYLLWVWKVLSKLAKLEK